MVCTDGTRGESIGTLSLPVPPPVLIHRQAGRALEGADPAAVTAIPDLMADHVDRIVRLYKQLPRAVDACLPDVSADRHADLPPELLA